MQHLGKYEQEMDHPGSPGRPGTPAWRPPEPPEDPYSDMLLVSPSPQGRFSSIPTRQVALRLTRRASSLNEQIIIT